MSPVDRDGPATENSPNSNFLCLNIFKRNDAIEAVLQICLSLCMEQKIIWEVHCL